jgi:polygalacturonase
MMRADTMAVAGRRAFVARGLAAGALALAGAFRHALATLSRAGGGTLLVPPGVLPAGFRAVPQSSASVPCDC